MSAPTTRLHGFRMLRGGGIVVAIVAATTVLCMITGEMVFRAIDGFRLTSLYLVVNAPTAPAPVIRQDVARHYAAKVPLAPGMRFEWFDLSPAPLRRDRPNPVLAKALDRYAQRGLPAEATHVFNSVFARERLCSDSTFRRFPGFLFLFDPPGGAEYPRYRFPRSVVTPTGLVTNQFGWRGPPIALEKAPRTIRIGFVGASTTVGNHDYPFSYPELVGRWLNEWLSARDADIRVEIINAGREAINSTDIAAVVRDELGPMEPDFVVYYEGANQFYLSNLIPQTFWSRLQQSTRKRLDYLQAYSAIARRLRLLLRLGAALPTDFSEMREPAKPSYELIWPQDVAESDPPLDHPKLPSDLSIIVRDLKDITERLRGAGSELVLSSFVWLVHDGMVLESPRDRVLYEHLNVLLAPYRYRDIARIAAFQNRVFAKFAAVYGVPFIDVASAMPRDANLFWDAVHPTYEGARVHAWIVTQQLAPLLDRGIKEGHLPRPAQHHLSSHPAFLGEEQTAVIECSSPTADGAKIFARGLALPPTLQ